jgi:predicted MPP superfamily phosphohydrolase
MIKLLITLLVIAVLALVAWHDIHNFVVRKYEVRTDKLSRDLTMVLLADLHGYSYGRNNEKLIAAIDEIDPDAVLCAGDMFTAREINGKVHTEQGELLLKNLASRYPVYMASGNHEEKIKVYSQEYGNLFERYRETLKRAGVVYLENESVYMTPFDSKGEKGPQGKDRVRISGLELELSFFRKMVKREMGPDVLPGKLGEIKASDRDAFNILIAHNPQYFKEYANWGADLTVSGHVHGGIVRLPFLGGVISPAIVFFPRYDGGKFTKDGRYMILSRGLGTHTIHFRLFNPAEVSVIKIKGVKDVT